MSPSRFLFEMVQKNSDQPEGPRRRGRPRAYSPDLALTQAMEAFWNDGFAATSLDQLSEATGMNRPSLYAAFGDKQALYRQAYAQYRKAAFAAMEDLFAAERPLRDLLRLIFERALDLYLSGDKGPRGCFSVLTASSDAIAAPELRGMVVDSIEGIDRFFADLFAKGIEASELPSSSDPRHMAFLASATLHTLSVRARAGVPRAELEPIIAGAVGLICGRGA